MKYVLRVIQAGRYPYPYEFLAWTKYSKKDAEELKRKIESYGGQVKMTKFTGLWPN